jgi:hypothetical protein
MAPEVFEILPVILGIFYTIRKLDAVSRLPEEFPHVARESFLGWQNRERAVYQLAALACVLKLVLGLPFHYLLAPKLSALPVRVIGASLDLSWLAVVLRTWWASSTLRKERARLGIWLGMRPAPASEQADEENQGED